MLTSAFSRFHEMLSFRYGRHDDTGVEMHREGSPSPQLAAFDSQAQHQFGATAAVRRRFRQPLQYRVNDAGWW